MLNKTKNKLFASYLVLEENSYCPCSDFVLSMKENRLEFH